jgi:hypothetical protein
VTKILTKNQGNLPRLGDEVGRGNIEFAARAEESKRRSEEGISADATYHLQK